MIDPRRRPSFLGQVIPTTERHRINIYNVYTNGKVLRERLYNNSSLLRVFQGVWKNLIFQRFFILLDILSPFT
ncbi:hypothetical protein Gasu2_37730 [Galdieria sulphuraria]|nr:hypothetical protein Gasu2_37730 [Galdieria sulphuraria]